MTGEDKNKLWNTDGMEKEIVEAIYYFLDIGDLDEEEVKI